MPVYQSDLSTVTDATLEISPEAPTVTPTPTEAATVEPLYATVEPLDATVEPLNPTVEPLDPTVTPAATPTPTEAPSEASMSPLVLLAEEGEHNWHYQYDGLSRVISACSEWNATTEDCEGDEWTYQYDGTGNLTRFDKWNASTSTVDTVRYVINGANQITCIDTDASHTCNGSETLWTYDPYGNLTDDGTTTYTYDKANRVSSITAVGVTTSYTYNGDGDRISQTIDDGVPPDVTTTYVLDTATPLTMVLSETTSGNALSASTTRYWHGLDTPGPVRRYHHPDLRLRRAGLGAPAGRYERIGGPGPDLRPLWQWLRQGGIGAVGAWLYR